MVLFDYKKKVDNLIYNYLLTIENEDIREMIDYSLSGGKRLRSVICLYLFDQFKINRDEIVLGIEFLHNASLILDDLPCMDNDDYRRNKLSFHKKYGIRKSYIVTNYLLSEFNKSINSIKCNSLKNYILDKVKLITFGQYYDLYPNITTSNDINQQIYNNNLKTTPFFVLSFVIPLYIYNNNFKIDVIEKSALYFSTAFQIYDDFLDENEDMKNNNFNHIKVLGRSETYKLYNNNIEKFNECIKSFNIDTVLFKEIINYLNDKLSKYVYDL